MKMKKAVIFDVGGVLITSPVRIIEEYEKELSLPRHTIGSVFVLGSPDNAFCRLERGEITLSEFCEEFRREVLANAARQGLSISSEFSVLELFYRIRYQLSPISVMIHALQRLRELGVKTCILTNNWIDDLHPSADYSLFYDYADFVLESSKLGIRKPDSTVYKLACKRLGVDPTEVVFLDDLRVNLKAAKQLGITTILVKDPLNAIKELEQIMNMKTLLSTNSKL